MRDSSLVLQSAVVLGGRQSALASCILDLFVSSHAPSRLNGSGCGRLDIYTQKKNSENQSCVSLLFILLSLYDSCNNSSCHCLYNTSVLSFLPILIVNRVNYIQDNDVVKVRHRRMSYLRFGFVRWHPQIKYIVVIERQKKM